jgi:hypothetical protein
MRRGMRVILVLSFCLGVMLRDARAVPSFARQTGLSCNVCHRNPPELTAFGRNFKLKGYSLSSMSANERVGTATDLHLSKFFPVSAMVLLSNTAFQADQPATQNNASGFPQQASIFLAGSYAAHFGGFAQITYTHSDDHFSMDNTDLRFANHTKLKGEDDDYGITMNNNPTVEDLWNSTPAWGFPWISSAAAVGPIASPVINGGLAQDVAGIGAYNMWNNHLYTNVSLYRSEHAGSPPPISGTGYDFNITGVAPYWRAAWQQNWDRSYLEVGSYGIYVNAYPNAVSGATNRFADTAFDFQYARPMGANELDAHGTYIREKSNLGAAVAAGGATIAPHHLNSFKLDAVYHWTNRYSATAAVFSTTGTADALLYAPAALTGSNNGSPSSNGYILQFAYWPVQNLDINLNYTGYTKFNGASTNYDGANRNATDNNSVYMAVWLSF